MRMLDLFAGIGGFSLAGHWMGWQTAAFVEYDKHAQKVIVKNFPGVPIYSDIKTFSYEQEKEKIGPINLVCGGFPCQPFSTAGKRQGAADDRYLWPEMLRVIREAKPNWVVGENVAGLLSMDSGAVFEEVCTSLEDEGYKVESFVLPAISVGAPHRRDRVWIVARAEKAVGNRSSHTRSRRAGFADICKPTPAHATRQQTDSTPPRGLQPNTGSADRSNTTHAGHHEPSGGCITEDHSRCAKARQQEGYFVTPSDSIHRPVNTDTSSAGLERCEQHETFKQTKQWGTGAHVATSKCNCMAWSLHWYEAATRLCRVDDGLPAWVDANRTQRLKQLGNSIVPQVVYEIFKAIQQVEDEG